MKKIIFGLALFSSINVNAQIIGFENGSFENYVIPPAGYTHISSTNPGDGWVAGPVVSPNDPQDFLEISTWGAKDGNNFAELTPAGPSSISQTFTSSVVTSEGSISWWQAPRYLQIYGPRNDYSVTIEDSAQNVIYNFVYSEPQGSTEAGFNEWTQVVANNLEFDTTNTYMLTFASLAPSNINGGAAIDGIVLSTTAQVAAVPEPETYAMFLAGLGLLAFASRKRQA